MLISFENPKHEACANDFTLLSKKYNKRGADHATAIRITLDALKAADTLADMPRVFRPHPLKGEYKGAFAVDVTDRERVIFRPNHKNDPSYRIDNYRTINSISIIEIFYDYHDH